MQATKDAIRVAHRQELDVVRLYVPDTSEHHDPDNLLKEDQREIWWSNYSSCKEGRPSSIPEALLDKDIEELSTEPLLIYLLVLSGFHRDYILGGINRNLIYQRLFSGVHERKYEDAPVTVRRVLQDQFEEIMELIATAAWYGDGRTASVVEVRSRCPARLERAFNEITAVKGGFHRLIAAFYFQATERSGTSDPAFEFTHKTFGEYLTARSIVRAISEIHDALELRRDFYTERNAAESWFGLCSRQPMDLELGRFLVDELAMPQWEEKLPAWRDALLRVMQFALDEGVPLRAFEGLSSKRAEARARNAEEALLCALTTCSKLTGCIAQIKWPDYHSAGSLIHRFRSQRFVPMRSLALGHLNYLDLNQQNFMNQDVFEANFEGSNLESASFFNADVRGVNFSSCKMTNADLSDTSIDRCNFSGCDLERADFSRTHGFEFMRFYDDQDDYFRVQFRNAKLAGANFVHAELYGADFRDADLRKSDFRGAKLQGARFSGARLEGALFENAKLYGVDISPSEFAISSAELADFTDDGKAEAAFTLQFRSGNSLDRDGGGS